MIVLLLVSLSYQEPDIYTIPLEPAPLCTGVYCIPSDADRLTKRIAKAGKIMGIELLDHVIVAEDGSYSFKTSGVL